MYARFSPPAWRGTFYGLKFILAFGLGWPAVELAGWVYGVQESFGLLFMVLAGVSAIAVLVALGLPRSPQGIGLARPA